MFSIYQLLKEIIQVLILNFSVILGELYTNITVISRRDGLLLCSASCCFDQKSLTMNLQTCAMYWICFLCR